MGPEETAAGAHYKLVCGACAVGGPGVRRYGNSRYSGEPHFIRFANLQSPWPDGAGAAEYVSTTRSHLGALGILDQPVPSSPSPDVARYLLNQSHVAKYPPSRVGRFGRRTSGLALLFGLKVQMSADLARSRSRARRRLVMGSKTLRHPLHYSWRNASIGSILDARRAGR